MRMNKLSYTQQLLSIEKTINQRKVFCDKKIPGKPLQKFNVFNVSNFKFFLSNVARVRKGKLTCNEDLILPALENYKFKIQI